ncbi:MAG: 50S ribosomal protein L32 [Desulfobacteraceae bacterium]|nr:MAG: 50S ribosomal protein L32 [Desulfobacteraceae bacterium]
MGLPKHKLSKARRDSRRTHKKTASPSVSKCPQCGETKQPHHVCPSCGSYKGRTVIEPEEE